MQLLHVTCLPLSNQQINKVDCHTVRLREKEERQTDREKRGGGHISEFQCSNSVCVCVRERESERERVCRVSNVCVCVCVCV